jgi:hypothetical protein
MYYAQITNGVVTAVTETHSAIESPDMIEIQSLDASLLNHTYANGVFTPPEPSVDPCQWLIDLGPFYDRFGAAKMAVLTSSDAGVKAILNDVSVRKWIDLQRADVGTSLAYIGSVVPALTGALQTSIRTTPVGAEENRALRKLYF